jgi:hypothetical protein
MLPQEGLAADGGFGRGNRRHYMYRHATSQDLRR